MNHSRHRASFGLTLVAVALPVSLWAQGNFEYTNDNVWGAQGNFVYTNDSTFPFGGNTVSGFSVASTGELTLLPGSPFSTGGTGGDGGYVASNTITISADRKFLFASNGKSNDISVFTVDSTTGDLTLVPGSPFATGGTANCPPPWEQINCGISLAPTLDGKFLIAANGGSENLTVFTIGTTGALTPIAGSPFAAADSPDGIKVSPDNKFLAVAEPDSNQIQIFSIASNGALTSVETTPGVSGGGLSGVDINCFPRWIYGSEYSETTTIVNGGMLSKSGHITPLEGTPYEPGVGVGSDVVLIGADLGRKVVFVSNQGGHTPDTYTITVFTAEWDGALHLVPGSPFAMHAAVAPGGMASSSNGKLLYVANLNGAVSVFSVGRGGALTEVEGSPFSTGQYGGLESLVAFPPRTFSPFEAWLGGCYANAVQ